MFESVTTRLKCAVLSVVCIVVAICCLPPSLLAQPHPGLIASAQEPSSAGVSDAVPSDQACQARVNDTPEKLLECIQQSSLWNHLAHFQKISDEHKGPDGHGNRDTGTAGYKASVDYVAALVRQAGYTVTIQQYRYNSFEVTGVPQFGTSDQSYAVDRDWLVAQLSGGGTFTGSIEPVGGSGTGCSPSDFAGFMPGHIALLGRGACAYDAQVTNAEKAGAAAAILYGSGNASPFRVRLTRPATIPVVSVSNAVSSELLRRSTLNLPTVHLDIRMQPASGVDYNVIAESPFGDPNHVVVVDAHLDSIFGAGMLDNASGSTTILEIALNMAKTPTRNQLRYIWFGGEELGLLGSAYYTTHLNNTERARIAFDLDMDVTATPNFDIWIADPAFAFNVSQFPKNVVPQSKIGNQFFTDFFNSIGVVSQSSTFGNSGTDSNSFALIGIPDSGILTRQDCCKEQSEVNIWGGFLGNYEGTVPGNDGGCVDYPNRWCDNLSNNDPSVLALASKASAFVTLKMANYVFKAEQ